MISMNEVIITILNKLKIVIKFVLILNTVNINVIIHIKKHCSLVLNKFYKHMKVFWDKKKKKIAPDDSRH